MAQGYGRGSRKLGIPTANLPESLFQTALADVPTGVYLGWAAVGQQEAAGRRSYKAVVNVGYSPTFVGEVRLLPALIKSRHDHGSPHTNLVLAGACLSC